MDTNLKSVVGQVGKTKPTIYTVPAGKTALIKGQISNLTNSSQRGTLYVTKSGVQTAVSSNITVAASGASAITVGSLGLESGDSVQIAADAATLKFKRGVLALSTIRAVKKVNGNLVAVGGSTAVDTIFKQSADDGITWTDVSTTGLSSVTNIKDIEYGGGVYTLTAYDGSVFRMYTSTDMLAWTSRQAITGCTPYQLKYAASLWVVVGDGASGSNIYTSTDPTSTWTARTSGLTNVGCVEYSTGLSLWVVASQSATANQQVATAPSNGVTWTAQTTSVSGLLGSIATNGTRITIRGTQYLTTTNGTTWVNSGLSGNLPTGSGANPQGFTYASGLWVSTPSSNGYVTTSTDGLVYAQTSVDSTGIGSDVFAGVNQGTSIYYTGTSWLVFGSTTGEIARSTTITGDSTISYALTLTEITP